MCGRYTIGTLARLKERFSLPEDDLLFDPRFNVSPSQHVPVIVRQESNRLTLMEWGLLPSWAKDPKASHRSINARVEGILTKPTFRGPIHKRGVWSPPMVSMSGGKTERPRLRTSFVARTLACLPSPESTVCGVAPAAFLLPLVGRPLIGGVPNLSEWLHPLPNVGGFTRTDKNGQPDGLISVQSNLYVVFS